MPYVLVFNKEGHQLDRAAAELLTTQFRQPLAGYSRLGDAHDQLSTTGRMKVMYGADGGCVRPEASSINFAIACLTGMTWQFDSCVLIGYEPAEREAFANLRQEHFVWLLQKTGEQWQLNQWH